MRKEEYGISMKTTSQFQQSSNQVLYNQYLVIDSKDTLKSN